MTVTRLRKFPDYGITESGVVYSYKRSHEGIPLAIVINAYGYKYVTLYEAGHKTVITIHRLLATTYIENPKLLDMVDHIDRNKLNNSLSNLRWVTPAENVLNSDAKEKSSLSASKTYKITHPDGVVEIIKNLTAYAKSLKTKPQHLSRVANGLRPAFKGMKIEAYHVC